MLFTYYINKLCFPKRPDFLIKYLECPSLQRLKNIGYFCGMDYASNDVYQFFDSISRYDHSVTTSLLVYRLTRDKKATIAALFHDVGTPCFSHVIDYMNKDYLEQESTEAYTEQIMRSDSYLAKCLKEDGIELEDIIDFKKYSIVDNPRPKLCADRLDGIILTGIGWTDNISFEDIYSILDSMVVVNNEDGELEIGFSSERVAKSIHEKAALIDIYCHSKEDNYMMELLANITKRAIECGCFSYEDLYRLDEKKVLEKIKDEDDQELQEMFHIFKTIKKDAIPDKKLPEIKRRLVKPLYNGKRIY